MKKYKLQTKAIANGTELWMGIDAHMDSFQVTVLDREKIMFRGRIEANQKNVVALAQRMPNCKVHAVYEAGPTGYQLLRWLEAESISAFITAPSMVPTRGGDRVKTDKRDSLRLAENLRGGQLKPILERSDENYHDRELLRTRQQLLEHRSDACRQIRSKLLFHGIVPPGDLGKTWSKAFLEWLESSPTGNRPLDVSLEALAGTYRDLTRRIDHLDAEIKEMSETETYHDNVAIVKSIPGVGVWTAMCLLVELYKPQDFDNEGALAHYIGLTPSEFSTGEQVRRGRITRTGNERVRAALVEASWRVKRQDPELQAFYERISKTNNRGPKRAIVAVARKLAVRIRAMLRDGQVYRLPPKEEARALAEPGGVVQDSIAN